MQREHFWKPYTSQRDNDGRWIYELMLRDSEDRSGYDVVAVQHFFGFNRLGHEVQEMLRDHFTSIEDARHHYAAKKQELAANGFTRSEEDI
jgi:hypothetical protein